MKNRLNTNLFALLAVTTGLFITSCDKLDQVEETPTDPVSTTDSTTTSCLSLHYSQVSDVDGVLTFEADFDGVETLEWYGWTLDGNSVDTEGTDNNGDNLFSIDVNTLSEGNHSLCLIYESQECPRGDEYCTDISGTGLNVEEVIEEEEVVEEEVVEEEVEDTENTEENVQNPSCESLLHISEVANVDGVVTLEADADGIEELYWYAWYVDGSHVEDEGIQFDSDNLYSLDLNSLSAGSHVVCIKTETGECPQLVEYCVDYLVD